MPGKPCPPLSPSCTARSRAAPAPPWMTGLWPSPSAACDSPAAASVAETVSLLPLQPEEPLVQWPHRHGPGLASLCVPQDPLESPRCPLSQPFLPGLQRPCPSRAASCLLVVGVTWGRLRGSSTMACRPHCRIPRQGRDTEWTSLASVL